MPIVVTEAMQNNVAVIVSENTGTATIVKTEKCGLTYKNNNVEELTEKLFICSIIVSTEKIWEKWI